MIEIIDSSTQSIERKYIIIRDIISYKISQDNLVVGVEYILKDNKRAHVTFNKTNATITIELLKGKFIVWN